MLFKRKTENFDKLIHIKNLPLLILDETFNYSFKHNKSVKMILIENELKEFLKEQGNLNSEYEKLLKTKKIRLSKILNLSGELNEKNPDDAIKKMETNQELVEHINEKLVNIENKLRNIPEFIERKNYELFGEAVKISYNDISDVLKKIKKVETKIKKMKDDERELMLKKKRLEDEYNQKSFFLRTFIGQEGIQILRENYGRSIE